MVERCDYYSDDEYQYALALEEEYYQEEAAKEEFLKSEYESFHKAVYDYKEGNITKEEAFAIVEGNVLGFTKEDFLKALDEYDNNKDGELDDR